MTARTLGPPGMRRGGPHQEAAHNAAVTTTDMTSVADGNPDGGTTGEFAVVAYLRDLIGRVDDVPLIGELTEADLGSPRGTASIARAALAWLTEGRPDRVEADLRDQLAVADLIARWRVRMAGLDVRDAIDDWPRVYDVVQARRNGYQAVA